MEHFFRERDTLARIERLWEIISAPIAIKENFLGKHVGITPVNLKGIY